MPRMSRQHARFGAGRTVVVLSCSHLCPSAAKSWAQTVKAAGGGSTPSLVRQLQQALGVRSQCGQRREGCPTLTRLVNGGRSWARNESSEQHQDLAMEAPANLESEDHQAATAWLELRLGAELVCLGLPNAIAGRVVRNRRAAGWG